MRRRRCAGSLPGPDTVSITAFQAPLAQLAEQQTLNLRVRGSSPWRRTSSHTDRFPTGVAAQQPSSHAGSNGLRKLRPCASLRRRLAVRRYNDGNGRDGKLVLLTKLLQDLVKHFHPGSHDATWLNDLAFIGKGCRRERCASGPWPTQRVSDLQQGERSLLRVGLAKLTYQSQHGFLIETGGVVHEWSRSDGAVGQRPDATHGMTLLQPLSPSPG
jgi:hypothetical protein